MKSLYQNEYGTIYNKDCRIMIELPDDSIDLIATDPPYQLSSTSRPRPDQSANGSYGREVPFSRQQSRIKGFMGKEWDVLPPVEVWKECLRVLKPGAFAFIMITPRQDSLCQILIDLTQAGFQMGFSSIYWCYASGFPKAQNISKAVDTRLGVDREKGGIRTDGRGKWDLKVNREKGDTGIGHADGSKRIYQEEFATTPQAKALDGSYGGFQPKPALEIIIVAMKPLSEKTFVDQALKNRKGITWLDDGRIPLEGIENHKTPAKSGLGKHGIYGQSTIDEIEGKDLVRYTSQGRFPANLLCSDDVLNDGRDTVSVGGISKRSNSRSKYGKYTGNTLMNNPADSGSFSRYFDLDSWWDKKLETLPDSVKKTFAFLIVPKASKAEKNRGLVDLIERDIGHNRFDTCAICGGYILQNPDRPSACKCDKPVRQHNKLKGNYHPTCKPIKLMSYLITLGSREGDTILDPFLGSGTTALACQILGRRFIGYEIDAGYFEIAKGRLSWQKQSVMELK